jgi:hypothetical protein
MIQHKYIEVKDYQKVGKTNEFWLWHFTASQPNESLIIQPINEKPWDETGFHPFKVLAEKLQIPIFESKTKDSIDFLISLDPNITSQKIFFNNKFVPIILGFNYTRLVSSTQHQGKCYCPEGIVEIVAEMDFNLLAKLQFD